MLKGNGEAEEGRCRGRNMGICSSPPLRAGEPQVELSDYSVNRARFNLMSAYAREHHVCS